ncbi:MAG TPA: patatin-like phospholipase family protein [Ktedonobacterales bacterium]
MFTFEPRPMGDKGDVVEREQKVRAAAESGIRLIPRPVPPTDTRTAFVFSGGGARGALHIGALRALLEAGIRPDMVVGTSIGAWNAAWLARKPTLEGVEELANIWQALLPHHVLFGRRLPLWSRALSFKGLAMLAALRRMTGGCSSLYGDAALRQLLTSHLTDQTFENLALPLSVIATDLSHGGRAVFRSGRVVDALLASSAIPGIFPPVCIDGAMYADGGMVDGCSVETAVDLGARRIFVLAIGFDSDADGGASWSENKEQSPKQARRGTGRTIPAVIQRASQVMGNYQIQRAIERVPRDVEIHLISLSTGTDGGTLSFGNVSRWMASAYESTRAYLDAMCSSSTADAEQRHEAATLRLLA